MSTPYRKPRPDLYTAILAIALVAVIVAAIFAYLETADYGDNKYQGAPGVVRVDRNPLIPTQQMVFARHATLNYRR
ncbi:MAG TPA: hypothetical protein VJL29_08525 [Thermoguttaceae bacterium]|nr:hypothetical protein [Thermoguttaceae bacterium]